MRRFTSEEKAAEAAREVEMRKTVYERSRLDPKEARRRIEIMEEIAADYRIKADWERLV